MGARTHAFSIFMVRDLRLNDWQDPATGHIDPTRAVKTFHRPAAGDETPLPSDVRPPHILKVIRRTFILVRC